MNKLTLSYPLDNPVIIQMFGANPQMYSDAKYGGIKGHNGIDFYAKHGTPVYASHDGYASFQIDGSGGHGVVIVTDKEYDGVYYKTIYWHLCNSTKEPNFKSPFEDKTGFTKVETGDLIGYADNTGASTGDHLHFGLKTCAKGEGWGTWMNLDQNNGYNGAIDPLPFFNKTCPSTIKNLKSQVDYLTKLVDIYKQLKQKLAK